MNSVYSLCYYKDKDTNRFGIKVKERSSLDNLFFPFQHEECISTLKKFENGDCYFVPFNNNDIWLKNIKNENHLVKSSAYGQEEKFESSLIDVPINVSLGEILPADPDPIQHGYFGYKILDSNSYVYGLCFVNAMIAKKKGLPLPPIAENSYYFIAIESFLSDQKLETIHKNAFYHISDISAR